MAQIRRSAKETLKSPAHFSLSTSYFLCCLHSQSELSPSDKENEAKLAGTGQGKFLLLIVPHVSRPFPSDSPTNKFQVDSDEVIPLPPPCTDCPLPQPACCIRTFPHAALDGAWQSVRPAGGTIPSLLFPFTDCAAGRGQVRPAPRGCLEFPVIAFFFSCQLERSPASVPCLPLPLNYANDL